MTDRKNLKIDEKTYERLSDEKGEYETWNLVINRLLDLADEADD
jgi:predicted CopG family antitoxin